MAVVYLKLMCQYSIHSNIGCSIYNCTCRTPPITTLAVSEGLHLLEIGKKIEYVFFYDLLFYKIENPYAEDYQKRNTGKKHGFGLQNVKRCVD